MSSVMRPQQSSAHEYMRERIRKGDLSLAHASRVKVDFNADAAFGSVVVFVEALAVLSTLFFSELTRTTHINGMPLFHVIWWASEPSKVQW